MKRRELFWMLLPCLGLAIFAIAVRNRPGVNLILGRGPFQIVVESVTREPVTAYEVSQGYDSCLKVVIGHKGDEPPIWWGKQSGGWGTNTGARLMFEQNGKLRPVKAPPDFQKLPILLYWRPSWKDKEKHYEARILTHLSDIPARPGRIVVQANLAIQSGNMSAPISAPLYFSHVMRGPGEIIKAPVVSRESGVKIAKVEISPISPVEVETLHTGRDTQIHITLLRDRIDNSSSAMSGANFVDEHGRQWNTYSSSSSGGEPEASAMTQSEWVRKRHEFMSYECELSQIPLSAGRVWLKTKYSTNNAWPLEIKVPLRNVQGHVLYSPLKPAPFAVKSTNLRAANAQEKKAMNVNTVLAVIIEHSGALPPGLDVGQLPWRADWSQHLTDEKDEEYWNFKTKSGQISVSTSQTEGTKEGSLPDHRVAFLYYLPLQQMPARLGRLKFHADIALPGTTRVPVDVVVREAKATTASAQR